jgi:dTDP-4-dehydrorhamnose 3,5-epimerase
MIDGVRIKPLKLIPDERGRLMEILRADDDLFVGFGQVYMTTVYPGVVKGWHYHKQQTDHLACVHGMLKLVLYDDRDGSPTKGEVGEFFLGEHNPVLVQIPPLVLHGLKGVGTGEAVLVNIPDKPYDRENPDEFRVPPHGGDVPYDWHKVDK